MIRIIMDQQDSLGSWILVGTLAFGCFGLFLFHFFPLLFGLTRSKSRHKDLVCNQEGDCFMHPSGFNQVIVTITFPFFFLLTILHICSDIVWSKEPFCIFFFLSFLFFLSFVFL